MTASQTEGCGDSEYGGICGGRHCENKWTASFSPSLFSARVSAPDLFTHRSWVRFPAESLSEHNDPGRTHRPGLLLRHTGPRSAALSCAGAVRPVFKVSGDGVTKKRASVGLLRSEEPPNGRDFVNERLDHVV